MDGLFHSLPLDCNSQQTTEGYKMISKKYSFKIKCDACSDGVTSDRHPIDPSAQDIECWARDGI